MKIKFITFLSLSLFWAFSLVSAQGLQNLKFSVVRNGGNSKQFDVYVKNISANDIYVSLGGSNFALCIGLDASTSPFPTITASSPIPGSKPLRVATRDLVGNDSFYAYILTGDNGNYDQSNPDPTTNPGATMIAKNNGELLVASFTFSSNPVNFQLATLAGLGPDNQSYECFIGDFFGNDQTDYSNPFYSKDGGALFNSGGPNEAGINTQYSFVQPKPIAQPVQLTSFFAVKEDDNAHLSWTVANDANVEYYEIERSIDGGKNFSLVNKVAAFKNGKSENTYSLSDLKLSAFGIKTVYYRVKQVEKGGKFTYSDIRLVSLDSKKIFTSIYPNPASVSTKLVVDAPQSGKVSMIIRDAAGKTVQQVDNTFIKGINQQQLNVSRLAAGRYNVTVVGAGVNETIKLNKVN